MRLYLFCSYPIGYTVVLGLVAIWGFVLMLQGESGMDGLFILGMVAYTWLVNFFVNRK